MPLKRKLAVKIVIIFLLLAIVSCGALSAYAYWLEQQVDTDALLKAALDNTKTMKSYRFYAQSILSLNNEETSESILTGERDKDGNLHVWGEIMDSPLEIYQIGCTHYRYNSQDGHWMVLYDSPIPDNALLIMEINPIVNFQGDILQNSTFLGREKIGKKKYYKYTLLPGSFDHMAKDYFNNFTYTVWVDKSIPAVYRAQITARSIANPKSKIVMLVDFFDVNSEIILDTSDL